MKEEYENLTEYLLDLIKESHWNGQLYKLNYEKKENEVEKRNE